MNNREMEARIRALAQQAALPSDYDPWPDVLARVPRARRRRVVRRTALAMVAGALVVALGAGVIVWLPGGQPPAAAAVARRAGDVAATGSGLPPFELTQVTTNAAVGFQPEPPPSRVVERIQYAGPDRWLDASTITEPFHEGVQAITQIRNGPSVATISGGRVTLEPAAGHVDSPFAASVVGMRDVWLGLLAAGRSGRCTPHLSLNQNGPVIDLRPTVVLHVGAAPCPSADAPQTDGPATYWLDARTYLVLRAQLHGPQGQLATTVAVTSLRYHPGFPAGAFHIPSATPTPSACPTIISLPSLTALRAALAYRPLIPGSLPGGLRVGAVGSSGAMTSHCKLTMFTITYLGRTGEPAVQLGEAPQSSPSVRFPGQHVTLRPGLTGTLNSTSGTTILWWIQDGLYCSIQSGGVTAGVQLTGVPGRTLLQLAASLGR